MSEAPSAAPAAPTPDQTLQLRDGHTKGSCAAAWAKVDGEVLHVTAGLDGRVCCRRGPNSLLLKAGDNSDAVGFNCIAVTPDGKFAVTGDEQYTKVRSSTGGMHHAPCISSWTPQDPFHGQPYSMPLAWLQQRAPPAGAPWRCASAAALLASTTRHLLLHRANPNCLYV
jgi:hypothetical protein